MAGEVTRLEQLDEPIAYVVRRVRDVGHDVRPEVQVKLVPGHRAIAVLRVPRRERVCGLLGVGAESLQLRVAGIPEADIEGPVREMIAWVGLKDRDSAKPPTLSGGEQQRIAIARAVITRPEILIADEPTGNVDPDMAERLLHLFDSLNRLGTTVVVATHDFQLISRIPDARMMRIEKGRLNDPTGALRYPPGQAPA